MKSHWALLLSTMEESYVVGASGELERKLELERARCQR